MEQTIERIKAVLGEVVSIKATLEVERGKVVETGRKQDEVAKIQAEKEVDIENREAVVKPIEDVIVFKAAAEEVAKLTDQGRIALENGKNKFEAFMKSEKNDLATRKVEVSKNEALYKRELEALKVAKEDVAKELANLKAKVLGELAEKI